MSSQRRQLRLDLARAPSHRREEFVVSDVNRTAVDQLDGFSQGILALVGPAGAGKSHLGRAWAADAGAVVLTGGEDLDTLHGRSMLLEDGDQVRDEEWLFHLLNLTLISGRLLVTSRLRPAVWPDALPDLRSRLNALTVAELEEPDDVVLGQVILKLFKERNIRPTDDVLPFLLRRIHRSVPRAREVVELIDEHTGAEQKAINRVVVRQILEIEGDTPDLFE